MHEKSSERVIEEPAALRVRTGDEQSDRRPRVEVEMGPPGRPGEKATALIATGAETSFVRAGAAERLGLARSRMKWRIRGPGGSRRIDVAVAALHLDDGTAISDQLELGIVEHLPADCDLVIGRDGLANVTFRYDGATGTATLEAS